MINNEHLQPGDLVTMIAVLNVMHILEAVDWGHYVLGWTVAAPWLIIEVETWKPPSIEKKVVFMSADGDLYKFWDHTPSRFFDIVRRRCDE